MEQLEIWKDIPGYEGHYQCSSFGRIKSLSRIILNGRGQYISKEQIVVGGSNMKGYKHASLCKNGKKKYISNHRLVATIFIPNPENKPQVNHIDGNKLNNRVDNLEWCTNMENHIHAKNNNLLKYLSGEDHYFSKLKNKDVIEIRNLIKNGEDIAIIAKNYNVRKEVIFDIKAYRTYKKIF